MAERPFPEVDVKCFESSLSRKRMISGLGDLIYLVQNVCVLNTKSPSRLAWQTSQCTSTRNWVLRVWLHIVVPRIILRGRDTQWKVCSCLSHCSGSSTWEGRWEKQVEVSGGQTHKQVSYGQPLSWRPLSMEDNKGRKPGPFNLRFPGFINGNIVGS